MHRRQAIRAAAAGAIAGINADVTEEQAKRVAEDAPDAVLVTVIARSDGVEITAGTMAAGADGPADRRTLALQFDVYAAGATGLIAVDKVNDIDEEIGIALGAANQPGGTLDPLVNDLRWTATEIEVGKDQARYIALAAIIYTATYDVYYGNPT